MRREQQANGVEVEAAAPAWVFALFGAVLSLVDVIFNQKWLLSLLLERFATAENVRGALESSVYVNSERVTDDLVDCLLTPLLTEGSADVVFDTLSSASTTGVFFRVNFA